MRILIVHNHYQQFGGEDQIFDTEANLLESYGHQVLRYTLHNDQIKQIHPLTLAKTTIWNSQVYQELRSLIRSEQPQVAHFHNTFPLISPSAYYAVQAEKVPVVQTLHNYRLLCPNGLFFRSGRVCEDCLKKPVAYPGILHSCYRENRTATSAVVAMLSLHSAAGTWTKVIDKYIALSQFALEKLVQSGLPREKILFKPNLVYPEPEIGTGQGGYALFVGRLSPEKGTSTLLKAWQILRDKIPLKIVGDGPLAPQVAAAAAELPGVEWLGRKSLSDVYELMGKATVLIFPSEWYETFGRVAIEAFAKGTPVIASKIGAIAELVTHGSTGLHFRSGDAEDLATTVQSILSNPITLAKMRQTARAEFEAKYTAKDNYKRLMEIYTLAGAKS